MEHIKDIVAAVKRHHGGFGQASDDQCLTVWDALDADTQRRYLAQNPADSRRAMPEEKSSINRQ